VRKEIEAAMVGFRQRHDRPARTVDELVADGLRTPLRPPRACWQIDGNRAVLRACGAPP
jgi:hypothetical protein